MFMKLVCYAVDKLPVASNMYPTFQPLTFKNRGSKIRNVNAATYITHAKLFWSVPAQNTNPENLDNF